MQGYWASIQNLNAHYYGLSKTMGIEHLQIHYDNESEYLNDNELHSDVGSLGQWNTNVQINGFHQNKNAPKFWRHFLFLKY